ncbi:hypothetical protein ACS0TY_031497 [Phlomoides rotata]
MEAEAVVNLFDAYWFHHQIFQTQSKPINSDPELIQQNSPKPEISSQLSIHSRSKSHEHLYMSSPDSVLKSHLKNGREISAEIPRPPQRSKITKRKRFSKSLSDLEFEEVKGFTEIGFVFSEDDEKDSRLVEIIPGLQRLGHSKEITELSREQRMRPYLSEAWELNPLMDWRIPAMSNEVEMKDSLKCWAHTVASAVR